MSAIIEKQVEILNANAFDFERLERLTKQKKLTKKELERLNEELAVVKQFKLEGLYLNLLLLSDGLKPFGSCFLGYENYSIICYLLGITNVHPLTYGLPFERFFNPERKFLISANCFIKQGYKAEFVKKLEKIFGENRVFRSFDSGDCYYVSNSLQGEITRNEVTAETGSYFENVSSLETKDLFLLDNYSVYVSEYEEGEIPLKEKDITSDIIFEKAKRLSAGAPRSAFRLPIKECLITNNMLIYQEQLYKILSGLGFTLTEGDYFRRELAKGKRETTRRVKNVLAETFGVKGEEFYEYLLKQTRYTISKGFIVALLKSGVKI